MERSIILGGNEYKYEINFKMSYNFLKYRNRITKGFDFSKADKKVVEEIVKTQTELQEKQQKGKTTEEDLSFLNDLSPEAISFLTENQKNPADLFTENEIVDIVKAFTKIEKEDEIYKILDKECSTEGIDNLASKLIDAVSEVFINAKDSSQQ